MEPRTPEEVRAVLDDVLSSEDFAQKDNPFEDLIRWFADLFGGADLEAVFDVTEIFFWVLVATLIALVGWLLWRYARTLEAAPRARGSASSQALAPDVARRVDELRTAAAAAEREGDLVRALRLHFFALVVGLGERGDLDYRDAWTNVELLERGEPKASVERALRPLVAGLDEVSFGGGEASVADVRRMQALGDELLAEGEDGGTES